MIDINELRRLAQAATPGGWYVERGNYVYGCKEVTDGEEEWYPVIAYTDDDEVNVNFEANAAFIAAANPAAISELLDRLEAAEKDIALKERVIDALGSELNAIANERDELRVENEALRAEVIHIKEVEFPRKAQAVADGWRGKCERLEAKIEQMERQEPAGYGVRYVEPTNGAEDWDSIWMHRVFAEDHIKDFTQACVDIGEPVGAIAVVPLYAIPGAKGE